MATLFVLAGFAVFCAWVVKESNKAFRADCEAEDALTEWRATNPDIPISESTKARWLVVQCIRTHEVHHQHIRGNGYLNYLHSLLDGDCEEDFEKNGPPSGKKGRVFPIPPGPCA